MKKRTCNSFELSQTSGKKKVPLISARTERFAFEGSTANTQQVLLLLMQKAEA